MIVRIIKQNLHREICQDPLLHGLVLNLYLNGEEYPHRIDDYFPLWAVEDAELQAAMRRHMQDEDKHVAVYRKAIQKIGQPVVELPMADVYNEVIRHHTAGSFRIEENDTADQRTFKIASFMAHLHYLEKRIARSLEYHLDACCRSPSSYPQKAVGIVYTDETRHVDYTLAAVTNLLPRARAINLLSQHRQAEAKANLDFSARQMAHLTSVYGRRFSGVSRHLYRSMSRLLDWGVRYA